MIRVVAEEQRFEVSLTWSEALVLYDYFLGLDEAEKLEPETPAFDPAIHRAIIAIYGPLENAVGWRADDEEALRRAYEELREQHRAMWEE